MPISTTKVQRDKFYCLITGANGDGKSKLASTFPNPYFIFTEPANGDVIGHVYPNGTMLPSTADDVYKAIEEFAAGGHDYKTLVIDSLDGMNQLEIRKVFARNPDKAALGDCDGAWGKGQSSVAMAMLRFCTKLRGLTSLAHVVALAVATPQDMELPGLPEFQAWRMNLLSSKDGDPNAAFRTYCDYHFHLFGKPTGDMTKREEVGMSSMARMIGTVRTPTYEAKRRSILPDVIPFDTPNGDVFWAELRKSLQKPGEPVKSVGKVPS